MWFTHNKGMYCCIPTQAGVPATASDTAISCATPCLPTYLMGSFAYAYRTGMYCWIHAQFISFNLGYLIHT